MNSCMNILLDFGVKDGFLSQPKFTFIPEVMLLAPKLCPQVYKKVIRLVNSPTACCGFCSYIAIGATYLWQNDFACFQKDDILETLEKPRGFDCVDEYITDLAGFDHTKIEKHLQTAAVLAIGNTDNVADNFEKCLETMFCYGMTLEMNRLGLK